MQFCGQQNTHICGQETVQNCGQKCAGHPHFLLRVLVISRGQQNNPIHGQVLDMFFGVRVQMVLANVTNTFGGGASRNPPVANPAGPFCTSISGNWTGKSQIVPSSCRQNVLKMVWSGSIAIAKFSGTQTGLGDALMQIGNCVFFYLKNSFKNEKMFFFLHYVS